MKNVSEKFWGLIEQDKKYKEALEIVRKNSNGKIWLIGGAVYRNLVKLFYGAKIGEIKDYDFIVEDVSLPLNFDLPIEWREGELSRFGGYKFFRQDLTNSLDFVELRRVFHIVERKVMPEINNFLLYTPLNIHSLIWDIDKQVLKGEIGFDALERRVISANDKQMLELMAARYGKTPGEIIKEKAEELGFDYQIQT